VLVSLQVNDSRGLDKIKYAFIVPTYNYAHFIVRALDSIFCQKSIDFQVIVMDDGSTDGTKSLLYSRYSSKKNFYYYFQDNKGPNVACCEAIRRSTAEYIIFMAADDCLKADYIQTINSILDRDPSLDVVFGRSCSISIDGKRKKISNDLFPLDDPLACFRAFILGDISATTCGTLVKRKLLKEFIDYPAALPKSFDIVVIAHLLLKYRCFQSQSVFVDVYDHNKRFRNNILATKNDAGLVDVMFDPILMGCHDEALIYKAEFLAKTQKSRGRIFFREEMWREALESYISAVRANANVALDLQVLKRMFVSFMMLKWKRTN